MRKNEISQTWKYRPNSLSTKTIKTKSKLTMKKDMKHYLRKSRKGELESRSMIFLRDKSRIKCAMLLDSLLKTYHNTCLTKLFRKKSKITSKSTSLPWVKRQRKRRERLQGETEVDQQKNTLQQRGYNLMFHLTWMKNLRERQ